MQVIALVATGLQTRFTRSVMEHFMHRSAQLGHQTLQYRTWFEPESELAFAQDLLKRGLVGAALQLNFQNEAAHEILAYLHGAGLPFVQVDRAMPGLSANVVTSDNVGIGKTLTSRLLQDGHERIAAVLESYNPSTVADRLLGYRQALEARGLPLDETLTLPCVVDDPGDFQPRLESVLGSERAPTAFFCVNEFTARLVARTLEALGRDPLTEFALGMVDDNSFDEPLRVQGHRAVQDAAALGSRAAELLARAINDPAAPPRYVRVPAARYVRVPSGDEESVAVSES
jgi:LacI family transcriptional regulator